MTKAGRFLTAALALLLAAAGVPAATPETEPDPNATPAEGAGPEAPSRDARPPFARPDLLVETAWLDENMIRPELVVVDLRSRETYDQSHIPGSFWLDESRLMKREGPPPLVPSPDDFRAAMESVGVGEGAHVIAVDDFGGRSAAYLWWLLGYYGFDRVSLLDGGYSKWAVEGRATTVEQPYGRAATFTPKARPARIADADQVRAWRSKPGGIILDARARLEYEGKRFLGGKRPGRIPAAVSVPWDEALEMEEGSRRFRAQSALVESFRRAGVGKETPVVAYCSDGRRAAHLLFTLALAGLTAEGANYVGSWNEWSARDDLPIEGPPKGKAPASPAVRSKAPPPPPAKAPPSRPPSR